MSTLYIGDRQILPEKPGVVTGYTVNTSIIPVNTTNIYQVTRCGQMVTIAFDLSYGMNIPTGQSSAITGLPKPYPDGSVIHEIINSNGTFNGRAWLNGAGELRVYSGTALSLAKFWGCMTYITRD